MKQQSTIESLYENTQAILAHVSAKRPERAWMYETVAKYFELLQQDLILGKPLAWYFFLVTPEIFRALDVAACSPEYIAAIGAAMPGGIKKWIDAAEEKVPDHMCSANKFGVGSLLAGDMPRPDMIIHTAGHPCDSSSVMLPVLSKYLGIPDFGLDTPYWDDARSHRYFEEEFKQAVSFMEHVAHRRIDEDRLKSVVELSNKAQEYVLKIAELRKIKPCPLNGRASAVTGGAVMGLAGTPFLTDWIAKQYELARSRADKSEAAVPGERIRLVWIWLPTYFDISILDWMEEKYGAVCVMDLINHYINRPIEDISSKDKILAGLARKTLDYPMGRHGRGPIEPYLNECIALCRDYRADAAVFAGHVGCKYGWTTAKLVRDAIKAEVGIPTLTFEMDAFDPRTASLNTLKEKFTQFFETMF